MFVVVTWNIWPWIVPLSHLLDWQLLAHWLFLVIWRPRLSLAPLMLVATLAFIVWVGLVLMGHFASNFTFGACKSFILHTHHHLHQPLASFRNVNPLVDYLPHPRLKSIQEDQLSSIFIFKGNHNQHATKVLDVGGQWTVIIPLGELQKLYPISKHKVVRCEPSIQSKFEFFKEVGRFLLLGHPPLPLTRSQVPC